MVGSHGTGGAAQRHHFISKHVHVCRAGDQVVLLDLRRDKYFAIGGSQTEILGLLIGGWPSSTQERAFDSASVEAEKLLHTMVQRGLVTTQDQAGKSATPASLPQVTSTLVGEYADDEVPISVRQIAWFAVSALKAALALRLRTLESVVRSVERRKARRLARSGSFCFETAQSAVTVFFRLRPLAFAPRDACLFDSLALVEFLAREGLFPQWVIGVRTRPFGAHSWVQQGNVVLNDLPERVRKFTPILAA